MRFSERYKYKSVRELIQIETLDDALRNGLWSLLKISYWDRVHSSSDVFGSHYHLSTYGNEPIRTLCQRLWFTHFKKPLDRLSNNWNDVLQQLRTHFFECQWYEVYDFVEFVANNYPTESANEEFMGACNTLLEKELSAYRFVNGQITRITEAVEIESIEKALESTDQLVSKHLRRALELLSDRTSPDYRNSIKESISAVECLAAKIVGADKGTLGQLLKKVDERIGLHSALKSAFDKLYGYTSDESGIRHALMEQDKVDFDDAKFMLVTCSAFVNYVEGKLRETGANGR